MSKMFYFSKKNIAVIVFLIIFTSTALAAYFQAEIGTLAWKYLKQDSVALTLNQNDPVLAMEIGDYYFGGGAYDLEKAKEVFNRALDLDSTIPRGHYQRGRIHFINGNFSLAIDEIDKELELHPENLRSYYALGLVYGYRGYLGDLEKAEESFKRFIEWSPNEWAGHNDLAWIYIEQGKYTDAKDTILAAFEQNPLEKARSIWFWTTLGSAYLNLKEYSDAENAFLTAQDIVETMSTEHFWDAYPGNDDRNAEKTFAQFKASIYFNLGVVYEKIEQWEDARYFYAKYLEILPEGPYPQQYEVEQKIQEIAEHIQ